jgi:reverse gyrase
MKGTTEKKKSNFKKEKKVGRSLTAPPIVAHLMRREYAVTHIERCVFILQACDSS